MFSDTLHAAFTPERCFATGKRPLLPLVTRLVGCALLLLASLVELGVIRAGHSITFLFFVASLVGPGIKMAGNTSLLILASSVGTGIAGAGHNLTFFIIAYFPYWP